MKWGSMFLVRNVVLRPIGCIALLILVALVVVFLLVSGALYFDASGLQFNWDILLAFIRGEAASRGLAVQ